MRRILIPAMALALAAAACGDDTVLSSETDGTTATTAAATTATTATGPTSSTTTVAPTSSTSTSSTTTTSTTTTTVPAAPVTTHPSLPSGAQGRHLIPWADVDDAWVLALYVGDEVAGTYTDGPTALYLVSPAGAYYEITSWPAGGREPYVVLDWSPDGERALIFYYPDPPPDDDRVLATVDLATGVETTVAVYPETTWNVDGAFTEPTGTNVVIGTDDGTTEHLEVHRSGGANAVLVDRPSAMEAIHWLYGQTGTSVVVSDTDGIRLLDNHGALIRTLDTPGMDCRVTRWWSAHEVLAACVPPAEWAAGNWYHQVWLVPDDGSAATPMTAVPGGIIVVDFGFLDARRAGGETLLQWVGDCSASSVEILQPDGTGAAIPTSYPVVVGGVEMITPQGSRLAVRYWDDCGQTQSWLGQIELDGTFVRELLPKVADVAGIVSAVGM
ncbi:MAG: hypothetical protein KQH83_10505 [Actinobacteria bacterium]|nr:hypothetical protein [Actinomycetota bacterium]